MATKPAYRRAFAGHRTRLVPADFFYEWQRRPAKAGKPASKLPYAIHRADGQPMAFAALWEVWRDKDNPDAEPLRTCVIITTAANELMKPIHDRMPVILDPADWDTWLDPDTDLDTLQRLLVPAPAGDLEAYPVSTRVNNVRNDSPELLDPLPSPPAQQPAARPAKTGERVKTKSGGAEKRLGGHSAHGMKPGRGVAGRSAHEASCVATAFAATKVSPLGSRGPVQYRTWKLRPWAAGCRLWGPGSSGCWRTTPGSGLGWGSAGLYRLSGVDAPASGTASPWASQGEVRLAA